MQYKCIYCLFLYCRLPVTLASWSTNPNCFHQAPRGGPTGKPNNTQRTVYNKYKNKHDNNHNHRTYNTNTSHKYYSTYIHIVYHKSLLLISRSDSSENGGFSSVRHPKTFKWSTYRGNDTIKITKLLKNQSQKQIICCFQELHRHNKNSYRRVMLLFAQHSTQESPPQYPENQVVHF